MLTMRESVAMLACANSPTALAELLQRAGMCGAAVELREGERHALGLGDFTRALISAGPGAWRTLALPFDDDALLRDAIPRVARRLATRAPHVLWLVGATTGRHSAIVAWSPGQHGALRLVSLQWEPTSVRDSDAETLCALSAVACASVEWDTTLHTRIVAVLGRDALTRRFYLALHAGVEGLAGSLTSRGAEDARELALITVTRLLFLHFLEAKGWLDGERGFLANRFDECMASGGRFQDRVLLPLFFGTLNTPPSRRARAARALGAVPFLNGGLFARAHVERRIGRARFGDEQFGDLFDRLFLRFRFVAREDSATWSEASVDPEMLGRAFESLMADDDRRAGGVFYTPHELVARVADRALEGLRPRDFQSVRGIRVLDPACGSGAFLVHMLERIADLRRQAGDDRPPATVRRDVLARSIFGVDRSPTAIWLCELRLWLAVVIDAAVADPLAVPPLPNLDRNIRVGDALTGASFSTDAPLLLGGARLATLRRRYAASTGRRKETLARALDREERRRLVAQLDRAIEAARQTRVELIAAARSRDLFGQRISGVDSRRSRARLRDTLRRLRSERSAVLEGGALPFAFGAAFGDAQSAGGFDVVVGNPPWVRLHNIPAALRARLKESYSVYSAATWESGASAARAGRGFGSQVDLAGLFVERSVSLLRPGGVVSLLLPSKLWRSLAGGGVRRLLCTRARVTHLEDLSAMRPAFDAAVYPSLLVARAGDDQPPDVALAVERDGESRRWSVPSTVLAFDDTEGAPWLLLPPDARASFESVRQRGVALAASHLGPPRLGVKSGCNAAFVVRVHGISRGIARVSDANGETGQIEASMLRPALRGDAVSPWRRGACDEHIVWTHDVHGPLARLPVRAQAWLGRHYAALAARADAARSRRWWSLFRVDAAADSRPRVVWADIGRSPRALVLPSGDPVVPLNSCYVVHCSDETDAWALGAILNSRLAAAWLNAIAEPARGGYRRYLGWTMGLLPLPRDWQQARALLGEPRDVTDEEHLLAAVLTAYRLTRDEVAPLLAWDQWK